MRRADRLFDIIQALRTSARPMTAAGLAARLEVTARTVYRDVATLQARGVPIAGAAGVGYVLRRGFELPPLMFNSDEIEAVAVGMRLLRRTGDPGLHAAAESVLSKVTSVVPEPLRLSLTAPAIYVSAEGAPVADLATVRTAIREEHKLRIAYRDEMGEETRRTIWPIAIAYYVQATLIGAWCELRNDFRHFRADRVLSLDRLDDPFPVCGRELMARWVARFGLDGAEAQ